MKKDLKWLKEEVQKLPVKHYGFNILRNKDEFMVDRDEVLSLIDQLDETEVLSWEWIDSHTDIVENNFTDEVYLGVRKNDLQNLLVPKQELPVIPKYIADWIEKHGGHLDNWKLPSTFRSDVKYKADQRQYEWANKKGNMDIFMKAILLGYEVEEEQKYIIDLDDEEISDGNHYLRHFVITVEGEKLLVCDSLNAITFESKEEAQLIADYVGGRVEELKQ